MVLLIQPTHNKPAPASWETEVIEDAAAQYAHHVKEKRPARDAYNKVRSRYRDVDYGSDLFEAFWMRVREHYMLQWPPFIQEALPIQTVAFILHKQGPPGPPPRPGLQWKEETSRWIRPIGPDAAQSPADLNFEDLTAHYKEIAEDIGELGRKRGPEAKEAVRHLREQIKEIRILRDEMITSKPASTPEPTPQSTASKPSVEPKPAQGPDAAQPDKDMGDATELTPKHTDWGQGINTRDIPIQMTMSREEFSEAWGFFRDFYQDVQRASMELLTDDVDQTATNENLGTAGWMLDRMSQVSMPLARGLTLDAEELAKYTQGATVLLPLSSFSKNPEVAQGYADTSSEASGSTPVIFETTPGTKAMSPGKEGPDPQEMVSAGHFKVARVGKRGKYTVISLEPDSGLGGTKKALLLSFARLAMDKRGPPGPPPRPGLEWHEETHRWRRSEKPSVPQGAPSKTKPLGNTPDNFEQLVSVYLQPSEGEESDEYYQALDKLQEWAQSNIEQQLTPDEQGNIKKILDKFTSGDASGAGLKFSPEAEKILSSVSRQLFGDKPRTLYRGLMYTDDFMERPSIGDQASVPADKHSSWTTDIGVARNFSEGGFVMSHETSPEEVLVVPALIPAENTNLYSWQREFVLQNDTGQFSDVTIVEHGNE